MSDRPERIETLDVPACLRRVEQDCPSPRARGSAKGLRQAGEFEVAQGTAGSPAFLRDYPKLRDRLAAWTGPLADAVKARLQEHHARLSSR